MDFHAAMETFAEAWVAANTQTVVNPDGQPVKQPVSSEELPTQLPRDQLQAIKTTPTKTPPGPSQQHSPSATSTKSLPIHCIIEQTSGQPSFETSSNETSTQNAVELDSYAILPGTTLLSECVRAALMKLGYSSAEAMGAKGAIQIKNWKALTFEAITDEKTATIEDILGELTQVATLRIRICSSVKTSSAEEVKEKLLQLLLNQSHSLLATAGCPIQKELLASISNGAAATHISPEMRRAFDRWYSEQLKQSKGGINGSLDMGQIHELVKKAQQETQPNKQEHHSANLPRPVAASTPTSPMSHYLPGKTRMRTSFDPEHEIPRLQKWFQENQHPSREQMLHFLEELNLLDSRKGRRPLDLTNIIYWFKNARAAHRRANKSMDEDSFELEEEKESPGTVVREGMPFLPNRNAVYMLPYPLHSDIHHNPMINGHGLQNGHIDYSREPCDLSMNRKADTSVARSPSIDVENRNSVSPSSECEKEDTVNVKSDEKSDSESRVRKELQDSDDVDGTVSSPVDEHSRVKNENDDCVSDFKRRNEVEESSGLKITELPEKKYSIEPDGYDLENEKPKDLSNGKRRYESDDEELDSDYDDDRSVDGSVSSHEEGKLAKLHESYLNATRQAHFNPVTSSPSSQPLHIPQFPHPLAMHYFPLNTQLYAQQANQMKYHSSHHSMSQMSKSSSGQENGSHRKRRTRVFIDPLSEIPKLEKWFLDDTHPSSYMIDKYCEELNNSEYRQKFPKLEPKNVQLWFKNHRAKVKRMRMSNGIGDHVAMFD